jgi:hypothetical protein
MGPINQGVTVLMISSKNEFANLHIFMNLINEANVMPQYASMWCLSYTLVIYM